MTIKDGTFAASCFDMNSIEELKALPCDGDESDMKTWKLTLTEWQNQVAQALFEKAKEKFGSVEFFTEEYALLENAYICDNGQQYQALVVNINKEEFNIFWDIINDDPENETDESNMCNWEKPTAIVTN